MARHRRVRFIRLVDRVNVDLVNIGCRAKAIELIRSGRVMVNGMITRNPSTLVASDAVVTLIQPRTLRGTIKMRVALETFAAEVAGRVCLDVGAAAGGFTAALLEGGARKVYAVDTGYGQLQGWLRQDPRVVNLERTNLGQLGLPSDLIPEPVEVLSVDLSYVSLADALPQLETIEWTSTAELIALVKPIFELRSGALVDRNSVQKAQAIATVAAESCGWRILGATPAPATGDAGAPEVFLYGRRAGTGR